MKRKNENHLRVGLILGLLIHLEIGLEFERLLNGILYYEGVFFGCLLPDIDYPKSWIGSKLKFISKPINKTFKRRTITHSFLGIILFGLFTMRWWHYSYEFFLGLLIGVIGHIIYDIFGSSGVRLFYPSKRKIRLKRGKKR